MRQRPANAIARASDSGSMLEALLVLDRAMVEISMRLYNLPRRERSAMRGHHRRLHRAVRQGQRTPASSGTATEWKPLLEKSRAERTRRGLRLGQRRRPKTNS